MYEGVIYKYTNKINGKIYIGQTINEKRRLNQHKRAPKILYFIEQLKNMVGKILNIKFYLKFIVIMNKI